jgi:hypothetical protein
LRLENALRKQHLPLTEVVHFHSITLSARAITLSGMAQAIAAHVPRTAK